VTGSSRCKRVLIVDDSPLFVDVLRDAIAADGTLQVVGVASDGRDAVELAERLRPDVITMDVLMPVMAGLEAVSEVMRRCPTPILVLTSDPRGDSGALAFEALRRGALDVRIKPERWYDESEHAELRRHLALLAGVPVLRYPRSEAPRRHPGVAVHGAAGAGAAVQPRRSPQAVGLVASTGGPAALAQVLGSLPAGFALPVLVVQHLAPGFGAQFARWLAGATSLPVIEASDGAPLEPATVLVAPDRRHLTVDAGGRVALLDADFVDGHRPSGTILLSSLSRWAGEGAVGVVLTGMGRDGVAGLAELRRRGGHTVAQDEGTSLIYGMPREAWERGAAERRLRLDEIGRWLCALARERAGGTAS